MLHGSLVSTDFEISVFTLITFALVAILIKKKTRSVFIDVNQLTKFHVFRVSGGTLLRTDRRLNTYLMKNAHVAANDDDIAAVVVMQPGSHGSCA